MTPSPSKYFNTDAYIVASSIIELFDAVITGYGALGTPPAVNYRCRVTVASVTGHTDCDGTITINSETLTFTATGQRKLCTTTITASTSPSISATGLDCNVLIECVDVGGAPIYAETTTAIKVRHEPELATTRDPAGNFTTYNGYIMTTDSTIENGYTIRINSTDYTAKRVEPQSWLDGTETHRIVYF